MQFTVTWPYIVADTVVFGRRIYSVQTMMYMKIHVDLNIYLQYTYAYILQGRLRAIYEYRIYLHFEVLSGIISTQDYLNMFL